MVRRRFNHAGPGSWLLVCAGVFLSAAILSLSGCGKEEEKVAAAPPEVKVVEVQQRDVPIYHDWVGTLDGDINATISAQVSGYLIERSYKEGAVVAKDQMLFKINPAPFEAALARANAQLAAAVAYKGKTAQDVKRDIPLVAQQAISQQEMDDAVQADLGADAQIASGKAAVLEAELNLGFTTIRSPVDGVAGLAQAQIGDLVGPASGPLTTVVKIDPIRVNFSVSQDYVTKFREERLARDQPIRGGEGPELQLTLISGAIYPRKGHVRFSANQVNLKTGSVEVVGEFPNPDLLLVPGMFTRVRGLIGNEKDALLVPQEAVSEMQGRYLVAVVGDENKVSIVPVEAGDRVGGEWIVKGKLKPGDKVVAEGVQKVRDGIVVAPVMMKLPVATQPAPSVAGGGS